MENAKVILEGFKRFKSQKGNDVCLLFLTRPFSAAENKQNSYGNDVQSIFAPVHQIDSFKPEDIGKEVQVNYGFGSFGRPVITEIVVK